MAVVAIIASVFGIAAWLGKPTDSEDLRTAKSNTEKAKAEHDAGKARVNKDIEVLDARISEVDAQLELLGDDLEEYKNERAKLDAQAGELKAKLGELGAELQNYKVTKPSQAEVENIGANVAKIKDKLRSLKIVLILVMFGTQCFSAQAQTHATFSAEEIASLTTLISRYDATIKDLNWNNEMLKRQNIAQGEYLENLEERLKLSDSELEKRTWEISLLKSKNEMLGAKLELEGELKGYREAWEVAVEKERQEYKTALGTRSREVKRLRVRNNLTLAVSAILIGIVGR